MQGLHGLAQHVGFQTRYQPHVAHVDAADLDLGLGFIEVPLLFLSEVLDRHVGWVQPGLGVGAPHPRAHLHAGVNDGAIVQCQSLINELALVDVPHFPSSLTPRAHAAGALEATDFLHTVDLDGALPGGGGHVKGVGRGAAGAGLG